MMIYSKFVKAAVLLLIAIHLLLHLIILSFGDGQAGIFPSLPAKLKYSAKSFDLSDDPMDVYVATIRWAK